MWKYQCKRHLLSLLIGAAVGMLLFGGIIDEELIDEVVKLNWMPEETVRTLLSMPWLIGAVIGASALNGVLLLVYLVQKFNVSPMVLFLLFFLMPIFTIIMAIGMILLIPTIVVCIYGMSAIRPRRISVLCLMATGTKWSGSIVSIMNSRRMSRRWR